MVVGVRTWTVVLFARRMVCVAGEAVLGAMVLTVVIPGVTAPAEAETVTLGRTVIVVEGN